MSSSLTLYKLEDELLAWANSFELAETDEQRLEIAERVLAYLQEAREKRDRFVEFLRHIDSQIKLAGEEELNHSDDLLRAFAASDAEKMEVQRQKLVTTFERIEAPTCSSK